MARKFHRYIIEVRDNRKLIERQSFPEYEQAMKALEEMEQRNPGMYIEYRDTALSKKGWGKPDFSFDF